MKKQVFLFFFLILAIRLTAAPFYVRINDTTDYPAVATGETDYQGRTQYKASTVALLAGDVITVYDAGEDIAWAITALDSYGACQNFISSTTGITCNAAGCYNIYIKIKYNDDQLYIEEAAGCSDPDPDPNPDPDPDPDSDQVSAEYIPGDYAIAVPEQCTDVMIQAFYWDSYSSDSKLSKYGTTQWDMLNEQAGELAGYFDLVWLAPSAKSSGGTGYHPRQWCNQNSAHGMRAKLEQLIANLHTGGAKVIADIVVNHRDNASTWCDFFPEDFGEYGSFQLTAEHICKDDEVNTSASGDCKGAATGANDTGEKYAAARDLDHTNPYVQDAVKAYLKWMKYEMKYDGWRFDVAKGFSASYFGMYATDARNYFSVGEYLDGNYDLLVDWIDGTGKRSTAFDFSLKFNGLNNGLAKGDLSKLVWMNGGTPQPAGLIHSDYRKYAVTLVDNHDTFERDNDNDFAPIGNRDLILQANAFILSSPGIPCVFYPHWAKYKSDIKKMIMARRAVGVHSQSEVTVNDYGTDKYIATVTGKNGTLIVKIGSGSNSSVVPDGYTKAASGINWAMFTKTTTVPEPVLIVSPAGGKYPGGVEVTLSALNATAIYYTLDGTESTATNGNLYSEPIAIGATTTTLKAVAVGDGVQSNVQTHVYQTEPRTEPITVKFKKPDAWTVVNLWAWEDDGTNLFPGGTSAKWPGAAITDEGNGWWSHSFDVDIESVNFLFNDGKASGAEQTDDLYTDESACYEWDESLQMALPVDCEGTALEQTTADVALVYPNPATDVLNIRTEEPMQQIRIFSATGRMIKQYFPQQQSKQYSVKVNDLAAGLYLIQVTTYKGLRTERFMCK